MSATQVICIILFLLLCVVTHRLVKVWTIVSHVRKKPAEPDVNHWIKKTLEYQNHRAELLSAMRAIQFHTKDRRTSGEGHAYDIAAEVKKKVNPHDLDLYSCTAHYARTDPAPTPNPPPSAVR